MRPSGSERFSNLLKPCGANVVDATLSAKELPEVCLNEFTEDTGSNIDRRCHILTEF